MTDLATIRIPVDSSDVVQAVRESKNLERGIKMLVEALDSGAIGSDQFGKGLGQLANEFKHLFTSSQQAGNSVQNFADNLQNYMAAAEQAAAATQALSEASAKAETAFALANQRAQEELQTLRNRAEFAFAMAQQKEREAKATAEAARENQQIINTLRGVKTAYLSAEDSAEAFTQGLREQEAQALKTAKANQDAFNRQLGVGGPSATSQGAGYSALASEMDILATKYNKVYSASKLYENQLNELNRANQLGVVTAKQYQAELDKLNFEYTQYANSADGAALANNRFTQHVNGTSRGLNNFGMISQQVGYQVGDFFVQIQSGTNAFVAFGQQATQLAGLIPGLAGAILGIGIAVTTAVLAYRSRMNEAVEDTKRFEDALKSLQEQTQANKDEMLALAMGYESAQQGAALRQIILLETQAASLRAQATQEEGLRAQYLANQALELEKQAAASRKILEDSKASATEVDRSRKNQESLTLSAEEALAKFSMMRTVAAGIANEMARAAANTQAAANAALTAMRMEFSPAGVAMAAYGGRGVSSDRPLENQYGDVVSITGSTRPERRPTDIDFGYGASGGGGGGPTEDALQRLREQVALENELLGVSEAQARVIQALGQDRSKYSQEEIAAITAEIEAYNKKLAVLEQQQQIADVIQSSMEDAFMSIVTGTESVADAFKQMAYLIIQELYKVLVVQQLVGSFNSTTGVGSGIVGAVMGAFTGGPSTGTFGLPKFASGGSIMPNQPYLVGEHGPELVIPRHSGTVVNANQTAGVVGKASNGDITVQNNISVTGSDAAMVRAEVAKMIPQITNATKAAVIDARLRGGQMKQAFR